MSHYAVLVVGGDVEKQLAPYHEFESTGNDDQYVIEVDQTEEAREAFAEDTTTRYRDPEGVLHSPFIGDNWDGRFWRELTPEENAKYGSIVAPREENGLRLESTDWHDGRGYRTKAFAWPSKGWAEIEVPSSTVQTFAEFCESYYGHPIVPFGEQPNFAKGKHKYGYTIVDENGEVVKTIDRTNPERKWDWYSVGGRWNGFFKLKPLAVGVLGSAGANDMAADYEPPAENRADVLMKGDIDAEGMRDEAGQRAADLYDRFTAITAGQPIPLTWEQVQEKHHIAGKDEEGEPLVDWKAAREEYNEQPMIVALRQSKDRDAIWWEVEDFLCTREEYIQRARDHALTLFAMVKDGVWYERGRMGWWGVVSNEKDRNEWDRQFAALIDDLPDDTLLTVVDCHI